MKKLDVQKVWNLKEFPIFLLPHGDIMVTAIIQGEKLLYLKKTLFPAQEEFAITKRGLVVSLARQHDTILIGKLAYDGDVSAYRTMNYHSIRPTSIIANGENIIIGSHLLPFELENNNSILKSEDSWVQLDKNIFVISTKGILRNDNNEVIAFRNDIDELRINKIEKQRSVSMCKWSFENLNSSKFLKDSYSFEFNFQAHDAAINTNYIALLSLKKKINLEYYSVISIRSRKVNAKDDISRKLLLQKLPYNEEINKYGNPWNNILLIPDQNLLLMSANENGIGFYKVEEKDFDLSIFELEKLSENELKEVVEETQDSISHFNKWRKKVVKIFFPPNDTNNIIVELEAENKRKSFVIIGIDEVLGTKEKIEIQDKQEDYNAEYEDESDFETTGDIDDISKYSGSWASDVEGLSDDFIDDVLDSDPDAYWNID
ncbi:hypothetical protein [Maribellus luteus]|uniref:hypothetical protein n=1 Tax=Maribellus luteus TaxID=2305463 RepID=UPI0019D4BABB|nr:hypothetical protein [Maribellus luteus]